MARATLNMARTKRTQAVFQLPPGEPSKRRKAAEDGMAKVKDIVDSEMLVENHDDEIEEIVRKPAEADVGVTVSEGLKKWHTTSKLVSGGALTDVSKFEGRAKKFSHVLEIQYDEAFTLQALFVTEGALKGRRVLVLEPVPESSSKFRFMDLPAEIRTMIYGHLLEEDSLIGMSTYKPNQQKRRPVRESFVAGTYTARQGLSWDRESKKWKGHEPSAASILSVSKLLTQEAAPVLYGNNTFQFFNLGDLDVFLECVGNMRAGLRCISLRSRYSSRVWNNSKAPSVVRKLKDAKYFHTLTIGHDIVCPGWPWDVQLSPEAAVSSIRPLLKVLHKAQKAGAAPNDVLDLIKVDFKKCFNCVQAGSVRCRAHTSDLCKVECADLAAHCDVVTANFRSLVANALGMEE